MKSHNCPCGSQNTYEGCCGIYISGGQNAATPEALMRSRYTAYSVQSFDYIEKTMKEVAAEDFDQVSALEWSAQVKWLGLAIVSTKIEKELGFVEFIANYQVDNKKCTMHELSKFKKIEGVWYYVDGKILNDPPTATAKIGRNDVCPCGSNKKYKKCCGNNVR